MRCARGWHRTSFDREHTLYLISGVNFTGKQPKDVRECDKFDTGFLKCSELARIPTPIYAFGISYVVDKVYCFGGYNNTRGVTVNLIQTYNPAQGNWGLHKATLPMASECSAAFITAQHSVMVWRNGGKLNKTYLFDFEEFREHGELFPGSSFVYSQTLVAWDEVYVWDRNTRLFVYDLTNGTWMKLSTTQAKEGSMIEEQKK